MYRVYVTDSLKAIIHANERYYDWAHSDRKETDARTGDEIIADIKAGLAAMEN